MGADYIQYIITDRIASPIQTEGFYSEKFLYMPHSFLAMSMAYQSPHMADPMYVLDPDDSPQVSSHSLNYDYHIDVIIFIVDTIVSNWRFGCFRLLFAQMRFRIKYYC